MLRGQECNMQARISTTKRFAGIFLVFGITVLVAIFSSFGKGEFCDNPPSGKVQPIEGAVLSALQGYVSKNRLGQIETAPTHELEISVKKHLLGSHNCFYKGDNSSSSYKGFLPKDTDRALQVKFTIVNSSNITPVIAYVARSEGVWNIVSVGTGP